MEVAYSFENLSSTKVQVIVPQKTIILVKPYKSTLEFHSVIVALVIAVAMLVSKIKNSNAGVSPEIIFFVYFMTLSVSGLYNVESYDD
jgi:hypothetical protein